MIWMLTQQVEYKGIIPKTIMNDQADQQNTVNIAYIIF